MINAKDRTYLAYLLRIWRVQVATQDDGLPVWRASLEDPHTGERMLFGTIEQLFDFLLCQTEMINENEKS